MRRCTVGYPRGFTLLELVVTIVIVGILATVGAVSFRAVQANIAAGQAQSLLQAVGQAQNSNWQSRGTFVGYVNTAGASLTEAEQNDFNSRVNSAMREITRGEGEFVAGNATPSPGVVSVAVRPGNAALGEQPMYALATLSETGQCATYASYPPDTLLPPLEQIEELDTPGFVCTAEAALDELDRQDGPIDVDPPPAPQGLIASPGANSVNLSWAATPNTTFSVYRCDGVCSDPSAFTFINNGSASGRFTDSGLTAGSTYSYYVTAANAAGVSEPSSIVQAIPTDASNTPPERPTNVTASTELNCPTVLGSTPVCVNLVWDPVPTAIQYRVYRDGVLLATLDDADSDGDGLAFATTFTDDGQDGAANRPGPPQNGAIYNYRVDAVNAGGTSSVYPGTDVTTPPAAPTGVSAVALTSDDERCTAPTCVAVSWVAPQGPSDGAQRADVTGYQVMDAQSMSVVGTAGRNASSFVVTGLAPSSTSSWVVSAVNSSGPGAPSQPSGDVSTSLAAPAALTASVEEEGIRLTWQAPTGEVTGYAVFTVSDSGVRTEIAEIGPETSYLVTDLEPSTTYRFTVAAQADSLGRGQFANTVQATTRPGAVRDLTAVRITDTSVDFQWTPSSSVTYTLIDVDTEQVLATGVSTAGGSASVKGLSPATLYRFAVRSSDAGVENTSETLPIVTLPRAPGNVQAVASGTEIALSWAASAGPEVSGYTVVRCDTDPGQECAPEEMVASLNDPSQTTFLDTGLNPARTYFYAVSATVQAAGATDDNTSLDPAVVSATTIPTAVTNLRVFSRADDVRLTWTESAAADAYQVWRCAGACTPDVTDLIQVVPGTSTEFTDPSASPGQLYTYSVVAVNLAGSSALSNLATGGVGPEVPRALSADATEFEVRLSWVHDSTDSQYQVWRCTDTDCDNYTQVGVVEPGQAQVFVDTDVEPMLEYSYQVFASANGMTSEPAQLQNVLVPLNPPADFAATNAVTRAGLEGTEIRLSWAPAQADTTRATEYVFYDVTDPAAPRVVHTVQDPVTSGETTVVVDGYMAGEVYRFRAAAVFDGREGPLSVSSTEDPAAVVLTNFPAVPQPDVADYSVSTLTWEWDQPDQVAYANVYLCQVRTPCDLTVATQVGERVAGESFTITGRSSNVRYMVFLTWESESGFTSDPGRFQNSWTALPAPTAPRVVEEGLDFITVEWDRQPYAEGYVVYRDGIPTGWSPETFGSSNFPDLLTYTDRSYNLLPDNVASATTKLGNVDGFTFSDGVTSASVPGYRMLPWYLDRLLQVDYTHTSSSWVPLVQADSRRIVPGRTYTASMSAISANGVNLVGRVGIQFLDSAGQPIGAVTYGSGQSLSTASFRDLQVSATAPADAVRARIVYSQRQSTNFSSVSVRLGTLQVAEGSTVLPWTPGKLIQGEQYTYTLAASDGFRRNDEVISSQLRVSEQSPSVTAQMPPGPPRNVSTESLYRTVRLTFPSVDGADSYVAYRCPGVCDPDLSAPTFSIPGSAGATVVFDDTGLDDYTQYSYVLASVSGAGVSDPGERVTARTLNGSADPVTFTDVGSTSVRVSWVAPEGADYFQLLRLGSNEPVYTGTSTTFLDSGLTAGQEYTYLVLAGQNRNGGVFAPPSSPATVLLKPPAPLLLSANSSTSAIDVSWSAVPNVSGYRVRLDGGPWQDTSATTVSFTGLETGTRYTVDVVAVNTSGASQPLTVSVFTDPDAPLQLTAAQGAGRGEIDLSWGSVRGGASYTVYSHDNLARNPVFAEPVTSSNWRFITPVNAEDEGIPPLSGPTVGRMDSIVAINYLTSPSPSSPTLLSAWLYSETEITGVKFRAVNGSAGARFSSDDTVLANQWTQITWEYPGSGNSLFYIYAPRGTYIGSFSVVAGDGNGPVPGCDNVVDMQTCTVTGLQDNTNYTFTVTANTNPDGGPDSESVQSSPATAATRPAPPTNLAATANGTVTTLTWTAPAGTVDSYTVQRCTGENCTNFVNLPSFILGTSTSFNVTGQDPNTIYRYRMVAVSASGTSAPSNIAQAATIPSPPVIEQFTWVPSGSGSLVIDWLPSAEGTTTATSYSIQRCDSTDSICTPTPADTVASGVNILSWTDSNVTVGRKYTYVIVAVNDAGQAATAPSEYVAPPAAPLSITVTGTTASSVTLEYPPTPTQVEAGISYNVFRCLVAGTDPNSAPASTSCVPNQIVLTGQGLTAVDNTVKPAATYRYAVAAVSSGGQGPVSTATADARTMPAPPSGVTVTPGSTTITLNWTVPNYNPAYRISYCEGPDCDPTQGTTIDLPAGTDSYELGNPNATPPTAPLNKGTQYTISIYSIDGANVSEPTTTLGVTGMDRPRNIATAVNYDPVTFTLTWDAVESATSYDIARCLGNCSQSGNFQQLDNVTDTTWEDTTVEQGLTYTWRVRGRNDVAIGPYSNTANAAVQPEPGSVNGSIPVTPDVLTSSNVTTSSVTLSWNPSPGATSYILSRPGANDVIVSGGATSSRTITGLASGGVYEFTVSAANDYGVSPQSFPLQVVTSPQAPAGLTVTEYSGLKTTFAWEPVTGNAVVGYQLSIDNGTTWLDLVTTTSTTVTLIDPWSDYQVRVRTVADLPDSDGTVRQVSDPSPAFTWRTPHEPPFIADISSDPDGIALTIQPPFTGDPDSYVVFRCSSNTSCIPDTPIGTVPFQGPDTSFVDSNLASNTRYFYAAAAATVSPDRISAIGNIVNAWTPIVAPQPTVTAVTTSIDSPSSAVVSWQTSADEITTSYVTVEYRQVGDSDWVTTSLPVGALDLTLNGDSLPVNTEYEVRAMRTNSVSGQSSPWSQTVTFTSAPAAPEQVAVSGTQTSGQPPESLVTLTWQPVDNAVEYRVWVNGELSPSVLTDNGDDTVTGLAPASDFLLRLSSQNSDGFRSPGSLPNVSATTAPGAPDLAGGVPNEATNSGPLDVEVPDTVLAVNTDLVAGVTGYTFTVDGQTVQPSAQYTSTTGDRTVFEFANLTCGTTFNISAIAERNGAQSQEASTEWETKPCAPIMNAFAPTSDELEGEFFTVPTLLTFNTPTTDTPNPGQGSDRLCVQNRQGVSAFPVSCDAGTSKDLADAAPSGDGFTYDGLTLASGTQYGVRVLAENAAGATASKEFVNNSGVTIPGEFTVQTVTSDIAVIPSATNNGTAGSVTWTVQGPGSTQFYNQFLVAQTQVSSGSVISSQNPSAPPTVIVVPAPAGVATFTAPSSQYSVEARPCLNFYPAGVTYASGTPVVCGRGSDVTLVVPDFACPSGFSRSAGTDFCIAPATSCQSGFYRSGNTCVSTNTVTCPAGSLLSNGVCVAATSPCSVGGRITQDSTSGAKAGFCVTNGSYSCNAGEQFQPSGFRCYVDANRVPTCPSGYTWNGQNGCNNTCVRQVPFCPSPWVDQGSQCKQEISGTQSTTYTCPNGGTRSGTTCTVTTTRTVSGSRNGSCTNARNSLGNPPGWSCSYNSSQKRAYYSYLSTSTSTYAATASTTWTCPSGWLSYQSGRVCRKFQPYSYTTQSTSGTTCSLSCSSGYNGPTPAGRCDRFANVGCPSGFVATTPTDGFTGPQCQRYEEPCPTGGTVDAQYQTCNFGNPCPGTSYNPVTLRCEYGSIACPNGGDYNGTSCSTFRPLCPTNGTSFSGQYQHCQFNAP